MRLIKFVLLWCCMLSGAAHAAPVILVFGDSLSAGYGLAVHQAWPDLLQQQLNTHTDHQWQVVNASISGETTAGGLSRLPAALVKYQPRIVILALGANDGLRGQPVTAMQANLASMIKRIHQSGAQILLVGIHLPPNYGMAYTQKFQQVYTGLAQQYHIALLPSLLTGIETQPKLFQADGLHPIAAAENRVMENVWSVLQPLLKRKRS